jgi:hypothetical protein
LKGYSTGTTDERNLLIMPLRWDQVHDMDIKFHKNWFRHSNVVRRIHIQTYTHMQKTKWSYKVYFGGF